jgi:hypothetical protein
MYEKTKEWNAGPDVIKVGEGLHLPTRDDVECSWRHKPQRQEKGHFYQHLGAFKFMRM